MDVAGQRSFFRRPRHPTPGYYADPIQPASYDRGEFGYQGSFQQHAWQNNVQSPINPRNQNPASRMEDSVNEWFQQLPAPFPFGGHYHGQENQYEEFNRCPIPQRQSMPAPPMNGHPGRVFSHPPTNLERYNLFEKALMCGEKSYGGKVYLAIYWMEFKTEPADVIATPATTAEDTSLPSPLFENDPGQHAEERLLEHLRLQLSVINTDRLKSITIMQNASPCSSCADQYTKVLEGPVKNNGVQVLVVFSSFHWVRRRSCRHQNHRHKDIAIERHEENIKGLFQLKQAGVELRTTRYEDWVRLCAALQVPHSVVICRTEQAYLNSQRGQEDKNLKEDLEHICLMNST